MRIGVTNAVLSNTGDAAIYESIVDTLTREFGRDCEVIVFDSNAAVTRRLYPEWVIHQQVAVSPPREPARLRTVLQRGRHYLARRLTVSPSFRRLLKWPVVRRSRLAQSFAALESLDLVISSGGTYLVDHYNFEARVIELDLVSALGKPVILWTQSMGDFRSQRAKSQIRQIAKSVDAVFFRDPRSERAWGGAVAERPRAEVVADSVFALEAPERSTDSSRRAAISVRRWSRGVDAADFSAEGYEQSMRAAVKQLRQRGWSPKALSTCQGVPSYAYDDSKEAERIFAGLDIEIDREFHTPGQLLDAISELDLIITTRMHLAILGMISRVPVIAIAYEFKTVELFESLGLGDLVCRIEEVTPEWMEAAVARLIDDPESAVLSVQQVTELQASARMPAAAARELVT